MTRTTFSGVFAIAAEAPDSPLLAHRALRRLRQIERTYAKGGKTYPRGSQARSARVIESLDTYHPEMFKLVRTMRQGCTTEQLLESAAGMGGIIGAALADEVDNS